jgi:putative endonuclease
VANGYAILDRNWRIASGEIDLVLGREGVVVFAEVKTRATDAYGDPSLAVTRPKQLRLRRLGTAWLRAHDVHAREVRFDVVAVLGVRVRVIEDAF